MPLGKPNLLYVKDLYAGLSQSNYWKYENQTSGGLKSELPGVWKSNGSKTDINNNTDSSETDQIYSAQSGENISGEMREDERYRLYFQDKLEIPILEKNSPHDREILMEILELLVETVTSRKKFLRICGEEKPKEVVKSRLMKLDSMHIQYVMECLKSNTTQVRNIKQYLLAEDLQSSISSVTRALRELEAARLIERRSNGFSKPNQVFLSFPSTAQKCTVEMVKNEQPDCSKVSNTIAQNCTPNQINKNNLRLNQLNRTKEAYGRYRNVFLEDYSELEMEIAELDTLIEDLSAYMQSTGRKYADHAATLRSWSARKKRQQKPGAGIPDYTYNKEESL